MGAFEDLGVMVDGLEDGDVEEYGGEVEEIFRFDVFITPDQDVEIAVHIQELEVEGFPEFGEEYSMLTHTFAGLIVEHVGMYTEGLMGEVSDLPELDVELTEAEKTALADTLKNDNGSVLLYSFPVLIMEDEEEEGEKQLGVGFKRTQKADVMLKLYGEPFAEAEEIYQEMVTDSILEHGVLFTKAVSAIHIG